MDSDKIEKLVNSVDELLETLKKDLKEDPSGTAKKESRQEHSVDAERDRIPVKPVYDSRAGA